MTKRILVLLACLAAAGLVVVGCGDDDEDTTTASLTKAEFLKQGNAICKAGNDELDGEFENFADENNLSENKEPTEAQFEEIADGFLLPNISNQIEEIRALGAPEDEEDAVNTFLDNAEAEVEEIEDDPSLLAEDSFASVNKEAEALGLTACAEG